MSARPAPLAVMVALAACCLHGCAPPCALDGDCPDGSGCREGFCAHECASDFDCPAGTDCGTNNLCGPPAAGEVLWQSPAPGATVEATFDADLVVSFRAATATLTVERSDVDGGDACAPFVPYQRVLLGDAQQHLTQQVVVPELRSLGEGFSLRATLVTPAGERAAELPLVGPPSAVGGARFTQPDHERTIDASLALTVAVGAVLDQPAAVVSMWVEPQGGVPGPWTALGAGVTSFDQQPVLLAHGPQVIWLDADGARCGLGISGVGESEPGLELGLRYHADEPSQLGMRLLVESAGRASACDFREPGTSCAALRETPGPDVVGEQVLYVPLSDGVVQIAAVPLAAAGYVTAVIRVSMAGEHLGWLGPFPVNSGVGEAWIAGQVVVDGGAARLMRTDQVTVGAPW
ncbi:MAG: hypothetical protein HYS27_16135 [Deltaproteobacteria bacterium]|nr:hypothetical protein [Deltaproteobacteria bacterium]